MLRRLIPYAFRLRYKLIIRFIKDILSGDRFSFVTTKIADLIGETQVTIKQVIKRSYLFENKIHNIAHGAKSADKIIIKPNKIFSFWHVVGAATEKNGYKKGRNILYGVLSEEIGGGLCQLGSIVYHLALESGLEILERYNHSVDIYKEEDRFTLLGADAAIVYGYKDVRFRNNLDAPIQLTFKIKDEHITASLISAKTIETQCITFEREYKDKAVKVIGKNKVGQIKNQSFYQLP